MDVVDGSGRFLCLLQEPKSGAEYRQQVEVLEARVLDLGGG